MSPVLFEKHVVLHADSFFSQERNKTEFTNLLLRMLLVGGLPAPGEPGVKEVEEGHVHRQQADHAQHHAHHNL